MSGGSSASLQSMVGTISRVNTVASALKRFLSRDGDKGPTPEAPPPTKSASSASLVKPPQPGGSMKITDQVIEEVDEQMTIQSHHPDQRPTVQGLFSPTTPIDMPGGRIDYSRTLSVGLPPEYALPPGGIDALLSTSAPVASPSSSRMQQAQQLETPMPTMGTSQESVREELDYNVPVDEFEILKARREQERIEKQKASIARTISTAPTQVGGDVPLDTQLLMENLQSLAKEDAAEKRKSDIPTATAATADTQL